MKRIFLLCFLLIASTVWGWTGIGFMGGSPPSCGGTQTFVGNPGDTETFEYQEDDFCCTEFTVTDNDTIISTYDNTQVKNGLYAASIAFTGSGTEADNYIRVDLGSENGNYTNSFWFWPHDYNDNNSYTMLSATTPDSISSNDQGYRAAHYHQSTGSWKFSIRGHTSIALSTEAWHRIEIDFDQNATSTAKIYNASDVLQDTITFTADDHAPRYLFWGCLWDDADARATNYFDDIRFKSGGGGF